MARGRPAAQLPEGYAQRFLVTLSTTGLFYRAIQDAGVSAHHIHRTAAIDETFKYEWEIAKAEGREARLVYLRQKRGNTETSFCIDEPSPTRLPYTTPTARRLYPSWIAAIDAAHQRGVLSTSEARILLTQERRRLERDLVALDVAERGAQA